MADVEIKGKISVDAGNAAKDVLALKENVATLKTEFQNATKGSDEQAEAFVRLLAAQKDLTKANNTLAESTKESTGHFGKLKDSINAVPGPLATAVDGVGKLKGAFVALLANPLGLFLSGIVAVLGLLYKAFTNSFQGGQKMEQVFAGIAATGQALVDNITKIGSAIVKAFSFDFSGAKKELEEVSEAAAKAYNRMAELKKEEQVLERAQADNEYEGIKRLATLNQLKADASDFDIPAAERLKAINELQKKSAENAKGDMELSKQVAENAINQLEVQEDGANKNYIAIKKIRGQQLQSEIQNAAEIKEILDLANQARNSIEADAKAAQEKRIAEAIERAKKKKEIDDARLEQEKKLQDSFRNLRINEQKADLLFEEETRKEEARLDKVELDRVTRNLENKKKAEEEYNKWKEEENQQKIADAQAVADAENAIQNARFGVIEGGIRLLTSVFGKSKVIQKAGLIAENAVGIAKIIISTRAANAAARLKYTGIPGGLALALVEAKLNTVSAGIGIAASIAATAKGLAALGGGSAGGAVSAGGGESGAVSAPVTPQAQTTRIDQQSVNAIGNAAQGGTNRAYVVNTEINNVNERDARLQRAATIGG